MTGTARGERSRAAADIGVWPCVISDSAIACATIDHGVQPAGVPEPLVADGATDGGVEPGLMCVSAIAGVAPEVGAEPLLARESAGSAAEVDDGVEPGVISVPAAVDPGAMLSELAVAGATPAEDVESAELRGSPAKGADTAAVGT